MSLFKMGNCSGRAATEQVILVQTKLRYVFPTSKILTQLSVRLYTAVWCCCHSRYLLNHQEQSISHFQALAYANLQQRPLNMIKVFQHP